MSEKLYTKDEVKAAVELVAAVTTSEISEEDKIELTKKLPVELQKLVSLTLLDALFNLMERRKKLKEEMTKDFFQMLKDKVNEEDDADEEEDSDEKKECPKPGCSCRGHVRVRSFNGFDDFLKFLSQR